MAIVANAKPSGHGAGVVIQGATAGGVVVPGHGAWGGHGGWGGWAGPGAWGGWGGHGVDAVVAPGVAVVGPAASAAGHGLGLGVGLGLGWAGHGVGAGHGVAVVGPATVPAAIVGPSGKVVADGLYGVGHGSWGHGAHGHW